MYKPIRSTLVFILHLQISGPQLITCPINPGQSLLWRTSLSKRLQFISLSLYKRCEKVSMNIGPCVRPELKPWPASTSLYRLSFLSSHLFPFFSLFFLSTHVLPHFLALWNFLLHFTTDCLFSGWKPQFESASIWIAWAYNKCIRRNLYYIKRVTPGYSRHECIK